jgi:hypothetical protein
MCVLRRGQGRPIASWRKKELSIEAGVSNLGYMKDLDIRGQSGGTSPKELG